MAETLEDKRYPKPGATPTPTPSSSGNLGPSPEAEKAGVTCTNKVVPIPKRQALLVSLLVLQ
jgi:hypothetical protein